MTIAQLIELTVALGNPNSIEQIQAFLVSLDANGDDVLCILDLPNTPGIKIY